MAPQDGTLTPLALAMVVAGASASMACAAMWMALCGCGGGDGSGGGAHKEFFPMLRAVEPAAPLQDYTEIRNHMHKFFAFQTEMAPTAIRLAFHISATWDPATRTGGSNGATIRFPPEKTDVNNKGLDLVISFVEPIKALKADMSYGDMWTLAGVVAVKYLGGPDVVWRPGRVDLTEPKDRVPPNGRLPESDKGTLPATCQHVKDIFGRMGFTPREAVALCGAHCVGKATTANSKFDGKWVDDNTKFTNVYFKNLVGLTWTQGPGSGAFVAPGKNLIMLPSDMAMVRSDADMRKAAEDFAADQSAFFREFADAYAKLIALGF